MTTWDVVDAYRSEFGWVTFRRRVIGRIGYRRRGMPWQWREWMP